MLLYGEVKDYKKHISSNIFDLLHELPKKLPDIMKHLGTKNVTLIHGDPWVNNWMFEENKKPVLIDWQTCCIGNGLYDLATVAISCVSYW
jgi:thiamine kinase-like enzyme